VTKNLSPNDPLADASSRYLDWLRSSRDLSPHTLRAYEFDLLVLRRFVGTNATTDCITSETLLEFFAAQRADGLMPSSLRRRAAGVRGLCRWLMAEGLTVDDPWSGVSLSFRSDRSLPRSVPGHELRTLIEFLRSEAQVPRSIDALVDLCRPAEATTLLAATLMVATGLRVGELVGLRIHDVDIEDRTIRVLGKGRKERVVFLPNDWLCQLLRAYLRSRTVRGVSHAHLLFGRDGRPLTTAAVRARLRRAGEQAQLGRRVTPHMLRHSAATQLVESGVDIRFVQRLLGHASLSTTEIYTHVSNQALRRAITTADVLDGSLRPIG